MSAAGDCPVCAPLNDAIPRVSRLAGVPSREGSDGPPRPLEAALASRVASA